MLTIQSRTQATGVKGKDIYDFLLHPTDQAYQRWWPGTHLEFHSVKSVSHDIGNVVYMDEFIGKKRFKMIGIVTEAIPGRRVTWQLQKGIRLPVWLSVDLGDNNTGVAITHTIRAGFVGVGKLLDPIFRRFFSAEFTEALDKHVKIEFPKLAELLHNDTPEAVFSQPVGDGNGSTDYTKKVRRS